MVASLAFFALMDALVKDLGTRYSTMQLVFFRSLFAFVPLGYLIYRTGWADAIKINNYTGHALRILVGVAAMFCFFYAFAHMPLADVVAISFAAPVFVVALSVPLLGEKVGPKRWTAVLIGFAGVLIMVNPGAGILDPVAVIALIGTVFFALAMIALRKLGRTESGASVVFTFTLACTALSGLALPFVWITPDLQDLALLIAIGLLGGIGQIFMTFAFKHGDVAVVAPFEYTAILWATLLGFVFWGEIPGLNIWVGVAVVMLSGLFILFREANLKLPRGHARRLQTKR
ncbi:DMT family transporter [Pelagibius litoralis]|uniref:DMT family transporter n=2 Tax=Pelagibius litoralis TaxID=374515 RepID=A0A967KA53_9PROT|nr:DMT family transporter [Pelagibius litoralis]